MSYAVLFILLLIVVGIGVLFVSTMKKGPAVPAAAELGADERSILRRFTNLTGEIAKLAAAAPAGSVAHIAGAEAAQEATRVRVEVENLLVARGVARTAARSGGGTETIERIDRTVAEAEANLTALKTGLAKSIAAAADADDSELRERLISTRAVAKTLEETRESV